MKGKTPRICRVVTSDGLPNKVTMSETTKNAIVFKLFKNGRSKEIDMLPTELVEFRADKKPIYLANRVDEGDKLIIVEKDSNELILSTAEIKDNNISVINSKNVSIRGYKLKEFYTPGQISYNLVSLNSKYLDSDEILLGVSVGKSLVATRLKRGILNSEYSSPDYSTGLNVEMALRPYRGNMIAFCQVLNLSGDRNNVRRISKFALGFDRDNQNQLDRDMYRF